MIPAWLVPAWLVSTSVVAFLSHGRDKWAARHGRARTPEARLHILELIGGWPGAGLGMLVFRHKTRKPSYLIVYWAIVVAWVAGLVFFRDAWLSVGPPR